MITGLMGLPLRDRLSRRRGDLQERLRREGYQAAAAIWITGALGLAITTSYWPLGLVAGAITALILFVADSFPDEIREEKREP